MRQLSGHSVPFRVVRPSVNVFAFCSGYLCLFAEELFRPWVPRVNGWWALSSYSILPQWRRRAIGLVSEGFHRFTHLIHCRSSAGLKFAQSLGFCTGLMLGGASPLGPERWRWLFWIPAFIQSTVYPISASYMRYPVPRRTRSTDLGKQLRDIDWGGSLLAFGIIGSLFTILSLGNHTFPWNVSPLVTHPSAYRF